MAVDSLPQPLGLIPSTAVSNAADMAAKSDGQAAKVNKLTELVKSGKLNKPARAKFNAAYSIGGASIRDATSISDTSIERAKRASKASGHTTAVLAEATDTKTRGTSADGTHPPQAIRPQRVRRLPARLLCSMLARQSEKRIPQPFAIQSLSKLDVLCGYCCSCCKHLSPLSRYKSTKSETMATKCPLLASSLLASVTATLSDSKSDVALSQCSA